MSKVTEATYTCMYMYTYMCLAMYAECLRYYYQILVLKFGWQNYMEIMIHSIWGYRSTEAVQ